MSARASGRGQAMAEFVVALGLLAMLLTGLPALQRYHQLQFASIGAARELAWLGALDPAQANAAPSRLLERWRAQWLPEGQGEGGSQQADAGSIDPVVAQAALPGLAGDATQALLLPFRPLQSLGSGFDLDGAGLRNAQLTVHVQGPDSLPEPFAGLALDLSEHHSVLADGWGASGVAQAASRSGGLVPTQFLAPAKPVLAFGTLLLSVLEPAMRQLCLGQVNPEVVPADRLGNGGNFGAGAPVTGWVLPC
jgi:hypothetical protein